MVLGAVGGALVLGGLLLPGMMGPVQARWMALAHAISKVTTPIVMGFLYFVVLTPAGMLMRTLGHRPLRAEPNRGGYWADRDPDAPSDLSRQF